MSEAKERDTKNAEEAPAQPKRGSGGGKRPNAGRKKRRLNRIVLDVKNEDETYEDSYIYAVVVVAWSEGKTAEEWVKDRAQGQIDWMKANDKFASLASRYHLTMRAAGKLAKRKVKKKKPRQK